MTSIQRTPVPRPLDRKFSERELDIRSDLEFVDSLLKDLRLEAEPQARGVILDLAYTLARDKLVEAQRFAKLANRSNVSVEDLEMADLERTVELRRRPRQQSLKSLLPGQASLPTPGLNHGLLLPTFRHCQVGMTAELKGKGTEPQPNPRIRLPPIRWHLSGVPLYVSTLGPVAPIRLFQASVPPPQWWPQLLELDPVLILQPGPIQLLGLSAGDLGWHSTQVPPRFPPLGFSEAFHR
ncbi:uncharacterized protein LOC108039114 [Drosophila rhopaloa]|uniref:Uncharacterized protein n=1 Tax=Drosophila rhopaloa TaxID=1041015 RepID=A0ABM5JBH4_DRORH|nr:uncharacterized protein LOC108039114 [Drosophila rhopaloa]